MNKKSKQKIFRTVMATMPEHCQNPWFELKLKKLILLITKHSYAPKLTISEIITSLSHDPEEAIRWQRTPEQLQEDIRLEQSVGLMCGVKNI